MKCPNCAAELPNGATHCPHCDSFITQNNNIQPQPQFVNQTTNTNSSARSVLSPSHAIEQPEKKKGKGPIIAIIAVAVVFLIVILSNFDNSSEDYNNKEVSSQLQGTEDSEMISIVKDGHPTLIPNISYDEAYSNFFGNPTWRYFDADDNSKVVEFTGDCTYYDEPAEVYIQFVLNQEEETFDLYYSRLKVNNEFIEADDQVIIELIYEPFSEFAEEVLGEPLSDDVEQSFVDAYEATLDDNDYYE